MEFETAYHCFTKALQLCSEHTQTIEPIFINLGHAARKLRRFEEAVTCYQKAQGLVPNNPDTYSAMGFTYHLQDEYDLAIEYYHKALGMKAEDALTSKLLHQALDEALSTVAI
eukprot:GFYU01042048.1.p1 GENE.GFYU01042048.1~~GFYU01042048.1.p1  ORF type:complete len:126 (+),score=38.97 GFYU01042048.1:41-379(+)